MGCSAVADDRHPQHPTTGIPGVADAFAAAVDAAETAVEDECDGLAISTAQARSIAGFVVSAFLRGLDPNRVMEWDDSTRAIAAEVEALADAD